MKMDRDDKVGICMLGMSLVLIVLGVIFLIYCLIMASKISEQPWPRDAYVFTWALTYPMMSLMLIFFGLIVAFKALVRLHVISGRTVLILLGIVVIISFFLEINQVLNSSQHI